ncbi:MAG: polysaccharide biosynthesis tyrosine autokinase [Desulfuromonadales bacterium]|nr:polysaccharide biosynthesis tyrosine autokinase [Desulfuromonadales bacterium]
MSRLQKAIQVAAKLRVEEEVRPVAAVPRPAAPGGLERLLEVDPLPVTHPLLAAWNGREEAAGEAYRKLRSLVVKLTRGNEFRNLLMVTSSLAAEGKSLTTLNLALALAQEYDHSVVLVDADLRKPSIHHYLGITPEVGLSHCLKDGVTLDRALIKTGLGKLVVLPAGEAVADPVELLASGRMREILRELKNRYPDRYVLIDTPPVLPFADAQVLSGLVDAVLFVVREGGPKPEEVQEALASLKGARLLGAVYNDAESFGQRGRYYYQR